MKAGAVMDLLDAAGLVKSSYNWHRQRPSNVEPFIRGHVQAFLLSGRTLVIPGSGELKDYTRSNLVISPAKLHWPEMDRAAGNATWHKGFAQHALVIAKALGGRKPKMIIGHSLGAAAAQILGCIYRVPAVGFASPMPMKGIMRLAHEHLVLNVVRNDDIVCRMPPAQLGFRRVGNTEVMHPERINIGEDHSMTQYIKLMKIERSEQKIVKRWPH